MSPSDRRSHSAICDIVVQLTGSEEDRFRLSTALAVAKTFDAHIVGVHLNILPDILDITDPVDSSTIRTLLETSEREAEESFRRTDAAFRDLVPSHELKR